MTLPGWIRQRRISMTLTLSVLSLLALVLANAAETPTSPTLAQHNWLKPMQPPEPEPEPCPAPATPDPLLGPRTRKPGVWKGRQPVRQTMPIVVMAGHADSQNMAGSGTPGYAVDVLKKSPMDPRMRDELYWNFLVQKEVVRLGQARGIKISGYTPPALTIHNHKHPATNWSQAKQRSSRGEYILEIHFDAYRPYGFGSGLIPALNRPLNTVDESLAKAFGRFPRDFRGGLGGPRRGIGILEIGMLEGELEQKLRDPSRREETVHCLALRVVEALERGLKPN